MKWLEQARLYWPRRGANLPPGQREVKAFPRFSDTPLRWAPPLTTPSLILAIEGTTIATIDLSHWSGTDRVRETHDFHCVTTWSFRNVAWTGYQLHSVLTAAGVDVSELPAFARAQGADERHAVFLTQDVLDDSVMLATELDDEPLSRRHGGPLRLVSPKQYGYKNVKHLTEIDFTAAEPAGSFGPKEHLRARVALEERHSTQPNWLLRLPYRLTVVPTALAAERGLRKSPE